MSFLKEISLTLIFAFSPCLFGAEMSMKIGYFTATPHITIKSDSSVPSGLLVDYLDQYVFPNMNVKVRWVGPLSLTRYMKEMEKGTIDAGVLTAKIPGSSAAKLFYFSKQQTHTGVPSLIIAKRYNVKQVDSPSDLKNIRIGIYTLVKGFGPKFFKTGELNLYSIVGSRWFSRLIKMLKQSRIDAVFMPESYPPMYALINYDLKDKYEIIKLPIDNYNFHIVFSQKSEIGYRLKKMYDDSQDESKLTYEEFLDHFFDQPDAKIKGSY